ncbi:acetoin utilization AcuB family protein [Bacillus massiliigorillae]|uniref:acetoin utilization AcuB family protein n=1 Tax=Bacillus massiliigorillae TaxID=1243664 RepID=UPI0003A5CE0F|nr:acetoin utilization AcuB family protein [Bacillus massiliigorillae]
MILEEIMSQDVITLTEQDSIKKAIEVMREHKIRHIPIVNDQYHCTGLVSNQDIRDATPSIFQTNEHTEILQKPLRSIMKTNLITGHPLDFVEDVAVVFYENKIGCMPVLTDKKLVGIISETDLLHTFVELTGSNQPGSQIQVRVPNKTGMLSDVSAIFKAQRVNIQSVLVYPDHSDKDFKILAIRVQTMNPLPVVSSLKGHGYTVLWPKEPEFIS